MQPPHAPAARHEEASPAARLTHAKAQHASPHDEHSEGGGARLEARPQQEEAAADDHGDLRVHSQEAGETGGRWCAAWDMFCAEEAGQAGMEVPRKRASLSYMLLLLLKAAAFQGSKSMHGRTHLAAKHARGVARRYRDDRAAAAGRQAGQDSG